MKLIESSIRFLRKAMDEYINKEYLFSIVHSITAIELALKEKLTHIHENLIFEDIDAKITERTKTVSLVKSLQRLINIGVPIIDSDVQLVKDVALLRNQIVHHIPDYDDDEAIEKLGKVLNFLGSFLSNELQVNLTDTLDKHQYEIAEKILQDWGVLIEKAKSKAKATQRPIFSLDCPICHTSSVVTSINDKEARCHFCDGLLIVGKCELCGGEALVDPSLHFLGIYHPGCLDAFGSDYLESQYLYNG